MDIDEIFEHIGELGRAQKNLLVLLSLPVAWMSFHVLIPNFIAADPGWNCFVFTTNCTVGIGAVPDCTRAVSLITDPEEKCRHYGSEDCMPQFDTSEYTSIVSEWDLVCSRSSYPSVAQSAYFLGLTIGAWLFGSLADMYGRKRILFINVLGCTAVGLGYGLATRFSVFVVFRFLFGVMSQAIAVVGYSLLLEVVGAGKRSLVGVLTQSFFSVGIGVLALVAYLFRNWRVLSVFISVIGLSFLPLWRWIPESPRWLLVKGREEEAKAVLTKIARGNGRNMTIPRLKRPSSQPSNTTVSVTELFRTPVIRHRTLILLVAWFTDCMVYYGLSMSAGSLGGGRYISVALSGLVELPGLYISYHLMERIGRKWTHGGLLMLAGICCALAAIGLGESVRLVVALLGKCSVAASFSVVYLYSAELFPTEIRNLGLGVVSISARIGGILTPLILLMGEINLGGVSLGLPMVVMGCLGLLAGLLSLHLPETLHQPLPETLAELT